MGGVAISPAVIFPGWSPPCSSASTSRRRASCIADGKYRCVHILKPVEGTFKEGRQLAEGERKHSLEPGYSYLVESEDPYAGFDVFLDYVSHGSKACGSPASIPRR